MANVIGLLFGIFVVAVSVMNVDWFFERRRARLTEELFGRTGNRIIYGATGAFIILMSLIIQPK